MRVLVTGAGGQVGAAVVASLTRSPAEHEVVAADHARLDISDREQVEQIVGETGPDAIVNTAAMTNVDGCERDPDAAFVANALGPRHLAVAARRIGAHLVHVSTDYVFDGTLGVPYREWDDVNPVSVYGRSKLGGEREVIEHAPSWAIARTAWVYGKPGGDFLSWVVRANSAGELKGVVDDQYGSVTYAADLAEVLAALTIRRAEGLFHVANGGRSSRFDHAVRTLELLGRDASGLERLPTSALPRPAARPPDATLDSSSLSSAGIAPPREWEQAMDEYVKTTLATWVTEDGS